jgi:hypothetical protein
MLTLNWIVLAKNGSKYDCSSQKCCTADQRGRRLRLGNRLDQGIGHALRVTPMGSFRFRASSKYCDNPFFTSAMLAMCTGKTSGLDYSQNWRGQQWVARQTTLSPLFG